MEAMQRDADIKKDGGSKENFKEKNFKINFPQDTGYSSRMRIEAELKQYGIETTEGVFCLDLHITKPEQVDQMKNVLINNGFIENVTEV